MPSKEMFDKVCDRLDKAIERANELERELADAAEARNHSQIKEYEARERAEKAEAELAAFKWIPVSERLPETE